MNDLKLLTLEELAGALKSLPDWKLIGNEISLSLECADFAEAFALLISR